MHSITSNDTEARILRYQLSVDHNTVRFHRAIIDIIYIDMINFTYRLQKGRTYMLDKENLGKRIAFYRKEKGLTQKELANHLNISYQAVSKWEAGKSLPTVEMLYEISNLLNVTIDTLLNENTWKNRRITYWDSGLDTDKLHALKKEIMGLNSEDENLLSAHYADACLFKTDTSQMEEPIYSCVTCVPGSKEKLAMEYEYNKEICADAAASAINYTLKYGMKPIILKAMVVCGNYNQEQLYLMAQSFQQVCEINRMMYAGMEIAAQSVNYSPKEYHVSATVVGVQDKKEVLTGRSIQQGDILIGIKTEGIEGTSYPFVKVMLNRNPELFHAQIDEEHFFIEELLKANSAYAREIAALQKRGYLHGAFRIGNSLLNNKAWNNMDMNRIPEGLSVCIDLSALPVMPLYRFLFEQDMIGENVFPYHFHMGIGMVVIVPEQNCKEAMGLIGQFSECWRIGQIKADNQYAERKIWTRGQIKW